MTSQSVDPIYLSFLKAQHAAAMELAAQSDLLDLTPIDQPEHLVGGETPMAWIAKFYCKGLVRNADGEISDACEFHIGIRIPPHHLRRAEAHEVLTVLFPMNVWHPNVRGPGMCAGRINPGIELTDLLYQCFEILTWHNHAPHDPLNHEAAQWARNQPEGAFPIERRPLKRREIEVVTVTE